MPSRSQAAQPILLLDSASLYFRAFYGVPASLTSPDGRPVNAIRGFLDLLARLLAEHRPGRLVACWEADWRPAWRVALVPGYKAHRVADPASGAEQVPAELADQVPVLADLLDALGVCRIGVPGFEADDVIGTLATAADPPVLIVTGDRDLFQLVEDPAGVRVLYTGRSGAPQPVQDAWLVERYGVEGSRYADLAVLRGDPSDGLPGVPGVGERTAARLLARYGNLAGVIAAARAGDAGMTATQIARIRDAADYLGAAEPVVRVVTDVPMGNAEEAAAWAVPTAPADPDRLAELAERWGVTGPVDRLRRAFEGLAPR